MKHMLGYLRLDTEDGTSIEVINGARTLGLMRAAAADPLGRAGPDGCRVHPFWSAREISGILVWEGNDCWSFDSGQYGENPALWENPAGVQDPNPWEDPNRPADFEVAGFLPDPPGVGLGVQLESPNEARIAESNRNQPLELSITGTVVAGQSRGESAWLQWLNRELAGDANKDRRWQATVYTHCADEAAWAVIPDPDNIPAPDPEAPVYTTWDDPTPNVLLPFAGATPWPLDSGLWQLLDVEFFDIDPLTDQPLFPHCVGRRYVIRLGAFQHDAYDRSEVFGTIGGAGNWNAGETYTNPLEVGSPVNNQPPSVLTPPGLDVPNFPGRGAGLITRSGRWSLPDSCLRNSLLTTQRASTYREQLIAIIHNPSPTETVYNARIRLWEAVDGQTFPNTQVGDAFYKDIDPFIELRIIKVEPGETLTFDGRTQRATLVNNGTTYTSIQGRIETPESVRLEAPSLDAPARYWVAVELSADAGSYGDLDLEVTIRGAQESIPT